MLTYEGGQKFLVGALHSAQGFRLGSETESWMYSNWTA